MRSGFEVQKTVIVALFLRELRTRFGKYRLGYLWALLEPATHVTVLLFVFTFFRGTTRPGISFPLFLVAGIVPWFLFLNIGVRSLKAVEANAGLFNYRPVKPIDTVVARGLLEFLIYSAVYLGLLLLLRILGEQIEIENTSLLVLVFILLAWFGLGVGLIFMTIGDMSSEAEKIIPLVMQPLYFISGIFFSIDALPAEYRGYFLWNPVLHAIELSRHAIFVSYDAHGASFRYLFMCGLVANFIGMVCYRLRERKMLSTS